MGHVIFYFWDIVILGYEDIYYFLTLVSPSKYVFLLLKPRDH